MEKCDNQPEIPGVTTPDYQEEIPGVTTQEEEEEITEMDMTEEEDENTEITGVDQNTEDPGVNHTTGANNAIHGSPPGPTPTNDISTHKVETVNKSNTEEDKIENEEIIQDKEGFEFQVKSPSPVE